MKTLIANPESALAPDPALEPGPRTERSAPRLFEPAGSTLEDLVLGAWEDLGESGNAECPVCDGMLEPFGCRSCGSELS